MRSLLSIAVLAATGCNLVFGLDEPEPGAGDGGVDAPRGFADPVTLQIPGVVDLARLRPAGERLGQSLALAVDSSAIVLVAADAGRDVSATYLSFEEAPLSVDELDANADGISDLAAVTAPGIVLLIGGPEGGLTRSFTFDDLGGAVIAAGAYRDPTSDDLVMAHAGTDVLSEWVGNGKGNYQFTSSFFTTGVPVELVSADLDGTGGEDLLVSDSAGVQLYRRTPSSFEPLGAALSGPATAVLATRLDENDALDVLIGDASGGIAIWLGDGDGGFQRVSVLQTEASGTMALGGGDADGDGRDDDLVLGSPATRSVSVYLSADGVLAEAHRLPLAGPPLAVMFADLDGDGLDDLVVVLASEVMIFFGQ